MSYLVFVTILVGFFGVVVLGGVGDVGFVVVFC
jgi:hypothetical protein